MKKLLTILAVVAIAAALLSALAGLWIHRYMQQPILMGQEITFVVEPGSGLRQVANQLHASGLISEPEFFLWYSRLLGKAAALRAGEYRISPGTSPAGLLEQLVSGEVILHSLTIVEGWTFAQMLAAVRAHPAVTPTVAGAAPESLMAALGVPGLHPEGRFFPDTYRFPRNTRDVHVLRQAFMLMQRRLDDAWAQRQSDLPLAGPYEALVLASVIEKETALDSERQQIAGVFIRRLLRGMRLQTDPTVIYGLGEAYDGNLTRRDLTRDTPYNTYTRAGLPPTPIALPGEASLLAAVQPDDGDSLYFVATGESNGSHYFSATLDEHNKAVSRYLKTLRQRGKD